MGGMNECRRYPLSRNAHEYRDEVCLMIFCFNAAEVFQVAIEIKENSKAFYEKAQNMIQDQIQKYKNSLRTLHAKKLSTRKESEASKPGCPRILKPPTVADPENELDLYCQGHG